MSKRTEEFLSGLFNVAVEAEERYRKIPKLFRLVREHLKGEGKSVSEDSAGFIAGFMAGVNDTLKTLDETLERQRAADKARSMFVVRRGGRS